MDEAAKELVSFWNRIKATIMGDWFVISFVFALGLFLGSMIRGILFFLLAGAFLCVCLAGLWITGEHFFRKDDKT